MTEKQILVVEDEVIIAEQIRSNLKEFGYHVFASVTNGNAAQEAVESLKPDLILMDIRLKGPQDGIETAANIRDRYDIPVIFLTAHADSVLLNRAKQVNPSGYLIKPIQKQLLKVTIEIALHLSDIDVQRRKAEDALAESEVRWRSLVENSQDIIMEIDQSRSIRFLNRPLPGLTAEKMIGSSLSDYLSGFENSKCPTEDNTASFSPSVVESFEVSYQIPEGNVIHYEARIAPVGFSSNNTVTTLTLTLRDLTSFRLINNRLLEREKWLEKTFQQAAVGIVHTDPEGRVINANNRYCDMMGYTESELISKSYLDLTSPEFIEEQEMGRKRLLAGEIPYFSMEKKNRCKDGSSIWVNLNISTVDNEFGDAEYILGIIEDISERKLAQKAVQESEQKYRELMSYIPQRVYYKDQNLTYLAVNQQLAEDLDRQPDMFIAKTDYDFFPVSVAETLREKDQEVLTSGQTIETEEPFFIKGQERIMSVTRVPKTNNRGEIEGVLGVFTDITDRINAAARLKSLERELRQTQKMQALGTLAGGIAHDFNNILHPIIGLSSLGNRRSEDGSSESRYFSDIHKAAKRAKDLVSQILTFSRKGDQLLKPIRFQPLIKEALKMLRSSLPATIEIEMDICEESGSVLADPTQIHQVIMNLATNAFQAMQEQGGVLKVSLQPVHGEVTQTEDGSSRYICLTVADTGMGIPPEHIEKIFDPYFTTKNAGEGTGLGLSVVIGIVKSHAGTISVNSIPGVGTRFTLTFPVTKKQQLTPEKEKIAIIPKGKERIMIVDDEADIVFFQSEALKSLGYAIVPCSSSVAALNQFRDDPAAIDLLITDLTMPEITGLELSRNVLEIRQDLPVIICTGYSEFVEKDKASGIGIRQMLTKPVEMEDLAGAIRQELDRDIQGNVP